MHEPAVEDTPFKRASILELSDEELTKRVEALRERRLRSYSIYQAGLEAKKHAKDLKAAQGLEKTCEQVAKLLESVDKSLDKLEKKVLDIQAWRLMLGEDITKNG
jgi:hypothetical protein